MPQTFIGQLSYFAFLAMSAVAFWRGGLTEKATAALVALMCVATPFIQDHVHYGDPKNLIYLTNLPQLGWFVTLGVITGKRWLLAAAAFELLCTATEAGHGIIRHWIEPWVYISTLIAWSWAVYGSVMVGGLMARRAA